MNSVESAKYRKHLEEGGVPPQQAVAHADALGEVLHNIQESMATRDWVRAEIRTQLQDLKFDMVKWMITLFVTLFIAQTGVTIGAVIALIRYLPR
ncbi:hypothetical protein [Duganella sp. P38]|uniref:hypothetical protein n=1 Tax=Duganella sp. P38 TaxID=3423949 RepID=UPI003D7A58AD